ncbi:hypothetical protein BCE_1682 [Bacillus cereus ATCC 10987]|uniref:Uncharacterized protein n=1 Tax=Bacillus cereus (strain ATCC 10987 / NRS 248) TaxID=222523 RepID=Q73AU0_BACC1|nr:hypothetical protein BCE_1682 [Bacillus cereus ATCC 10987]
MSCEKECEIIRRNYMTKEKQRRRRFVYGDGSEGRCNENNGSNVKFSRFAGNEYRD